MSRSAWEIGRAIRIAILACSALLTIGNLPHQALGQGTQPPRSAAAGARARHRAVVQACGEPLALYCAETTNPTDAVICLKPYYIDLPLKCRHAVKADLTARQGH